MNYKHGLLLIGLLITLAFVGNLPGEQEVKAQDVQIVSPTPTQQPKLTTEDHNEDLNDIEKYIWEVFGDHTPKAMLLLKGDGKSNCAENRTLNPRAVNYNWTKVEGVWSSRDRGIFQINDKFHPLTDDQAFNYKTNIDYAYRMFSNDNYSFKRWTCGRVYGI